MLSAQETMLAIAEQNQEVDEKALQAANARQAQLDADNAAIQAMAAGPAQARKIREATEASVSKRRKPKQAPAPTNHPAKGVKVDVDATTDSDVPDESEEEEQTPE